MIREILAGDRQAVRPYGLNCWPFVFTVLEKWVPFYRKGDGQKIFKFLIADTTGHAILLADESNNGEYFYNILNINQTYKMSSAGVRAFPNTTGRRIRGHDGEIRTTELWLQGDATCSPEPTVDFGSVRESAYLTDLTSLRNILSTPVDEFWALLPNVKLISGMVNRYFGCPLCKSSMRLRDRFGRAQCPLGHSGISRKICFRISQVDILERGTECAWLSQHSTGFTLFDDAAKVLFDGQEASAFPDDNLADEYFQRNIMLHRFDVFVVGERRNDIWNLVIKDISTSRRPELEAISDATVFPPPPPAGIPLELIVGFNNLTEPLRVELIRPEQPIERTEELTYAINRHPKGYVLIINNMFESRRERKGSAHDVLNVSTLHTQLGYKVDVEQNVTSEQLDTVIKNFFHHFENGLYESCFLYIMSHGSAFTVEMNDGVHVELGATLLQYFSDQMLEEICPRLIHIPKVVVVATCQSFSQDHVPSIENPNVIMNPYSHLYVVKAAMAGTAAFRYEDLGSWFIHALCKEIMENAVKYDLNQLFANLQRQMKQGTTGIYYQMAESTGYCFDKFYFRVDPRYKSPYDMDPAIE